MAKILNSRLFRFLVCLILVCCILVNFSPFRAEASAIVAGSLITGTGVFATMFALSMGVVFVDLTADLINGFGKSLENHLSSTTTDEETEILKVWIEPLQVDLDSGGISQLPPDQDDDTDAWAALGGIFTLPDELKDNLLSWGKSLINGETAVEVEEEVVEGTAPDGFMYYGSTLLPSLPDSLLSCSCIYALSSIYVLVTTDKFYSRSNSSLTLSFTSPSVIYTFPFNPTDDDLSWTLDTTNATSVKNTPYSARWANVDILRSDGTYWAVASEPSSTLTSTQTITVEPSIYVGDIPTKVQEGTFDDDEYELPYINYTQLFQGQTDAIEALNNVATQLSNQTMTYEQYMEQIQTQTDTGTDPDGSGSGSGGNSGTDSGDSSGDSSETQPDVTEPEEITDITPYGLDLRDFFPFCIPFDLYDFFSCLDAAPEAPKFHWELQDLSGKIYSIDIDLSPWNDLATFFRQLELALFIAALAAASRKFIKW